MWGSARFPLACTTSGPAGSIGTAGKYFSLALVLDVELLEPDGELLVALGHLGLAADDLGPAQRFTVAQGAHKSPKQQATVL
jgi:hypothetical protein